MPLPVRLLSVGSHTPAVRVTSAELDAVEKNRLSHRGQALTRLVEQLERRFSARR